MKRSTAADKVTRNLRNLSPNTSFGGCGTKLSNRSSRQNKDIPQYPLPDKVTNLTGRVLRIDLPAGRCQETVSLSAPSSPGVCSWSFCPAASRTPGKPWREGTGGGVEERGRGRKSTRNTSHPLGRVSAITRALTFYMRSESNSGAAEAAVSNKVTAADLFFCYSISFLLFFFSCYTSTKAEVWTSP